MRYGHFPDEQPLVVPTHVLDSWHLGKEGNYYVGHHFDESNKAVVETTTDKASAMKFDSERQASQNAIKLWTAKVGTFHAQPIA